VDKQIRRAAKKTLKDHFGAEMQAQKKYVETGMKGRIHKL
jgi:hypothetical protein